MMALFGKKNVFFNDRALYLIQPIRTPFLVLQRACSILAVVGRIYDCSSRKTLCLHQNISIRARFGVFSPK